MSGQHIIQQLLAKNNIILDQDSITMIEDNIPDKKYNCDKYTRSKGFTLLHKLVLISGADLRFADKYPKMSNVIKEYILLYPEEVNKINEKGWSALSLAISNKAFKIVKLLLEHNASINVKDNNGWTALIRVSYNATESSRKIVKLLLEHNADINIKSNGGRTALIYASYNATKSSSKIVKLLLEHNANAPAERRRNINAKDNYGWTALMCASYDTTESSLKIVKLLLEHNASINIKSNDGWTALMYALRYTTESSQKIAKLLLEHDSVPDEKKLCAVKNIKVLNEKN